MELIQQKEKHIVGYRTQLQKTHRTIKTQPNKDGYLTTTKDSFRPCRPPTSAMKKVGPFVSVGKQVFTLCISVDGIGCQVP